jgi:monofunctional biosynthetic peptidoglycan transglycosylase
MVLTRQSFTPFLRKLLTWVFRAFLIYLGTVVFLIIIFRWVPVPTTSFMVQHNLKVMLGHLDADYARYEWKAYDEISRHIPIAVVAAEDQRFPQHKGLDFQAIRYALNSKQAKRPGASTITQQVAKNLFLWSGRDYFRKGLEAFYAVLIELFWPKERILEVYLNIAQFGKQEYGVGIAVKALLKKKQLTVSKSDAALIAAVLPAPSVRNIKKPNARIKKRQRWIMRQVKQLGGERYLQR